MRNLFLVFSILIANGYGNLRTKRDDASFLSDSGGPVASESENESGNSGLLPADLQAEIAKMDPCESNLLKGKININDISLKDKQPSFGSHLQLKSLPAKASENNRFQDFKTDVEKKFKEFAAKFNKTYLTEADLQKARGFFKENLEKLVNLLKQRRSPFDASFVITKFSDINFDGFKSFHLGALPPLGNEQSSTVNLNSLVSSLLVKRNCKKLNWTSIDVIPPVRKQDKCGCCYAMSTADLVAAQYSIDRKNYSKVVLSPQWISDCMPQPVGYKCNGGRPVKVLEELTNKTMWRIPTESCYPYLDKNSTCTFSKNCSSTPPIQVKWGKMVSIEGQNEMDLMAALLQHGPVVAIVGVTDSWQMYNGTGIIRPYQCDTQQNHAVLVTGYDYTTCVPNYIIKNSWGTDWGGRGYIKLEAGKNTCNIAKSLILTCTSDDCLKKNVDPLKYVLSTSKHPECK